MKIIENVDFTNLTAYCIKLYRGITSHIKYEDILNNFDMDVRETCQKLNGTCNYSLSQYREFCEKVCNLEKSFNCSLLYGEYIYVDE